MPIVLKSGSLNLLEPSGPFQACTFTLPSLLVMNTVVDISLLLAALSTSKARRAWGVSGILATRYFVKLNENAVCIFFIFTN